MGQVFQTLPGGSLLVVDGWLFVLGVCLVARCLVVVGGLQMPCSLPCCIAWTPWWLRRAWLVNMQRMSSTSTRDDA